MHLYSTTLTALDVELLADEIDAYAYRLTDLGVITRGWRKGQHHFKFVLRPIPAGSKYNAIADNGRRVWAISWEGHRMFMRRVFDSDPHAEIDSTLARYIGVEQFENLHMLTGTNINRGYKAKVVA